MRVLLISNSLSHNIVEPIGENLASNGHEVTLIRHPLTRSDDRRTIHVVSAGEIRLLRQKYIRARPPFSYFFDLFWPVTLSNFEVVISFACHNTLRALWLRRLQRVKYVIHWNIDFSPRRFSSSFANRLYDSLDKFAVQNSDAHFELTETALLARLSRYVMSRRDTDLVAPVGIESNRVPTVDVMRFEKKKIVVIGRTNVPETE